MANRRFRIFCRSETSNEYSVIVESPFAKKFLLLQSSAILTLEDSESTALYKQQYQKLVDGYGLMGILRLNNGYL